MNATSSDGVKIALIDGGSSTGRRVVFVHGIAQSKAAWAPIFESPLAKTHRLVAYDLRGHGDSDKPGGAALQRPLLADDLAAVIEGLDHPVVVAWSFGGTVIGEYLRKFGDGALGGIVLAAAAIRSGREAKELFGPVMMGNARALMSDDPTVYESGARTFFADSVAAPLPASIVEHGVNEMLRVPAHVRRAYLSGGDDYVADVSRVKVPLTTIHGTTDRVVLPAMSDLIPHARAVRLEGLGHVPWLEAPGDFVRALTAAIDS